MSNKIYPNTTPFAHERNTNVNFNYVWDNETSNWVPQSQSSLSLDYVLANAKDYIHKFGSNPNVNQNVSIDLPETIWDGSSEYAFPPNTATGVVIKSTNANDSQQITIEGLGENFNKQTWSGNLNGTTDVAVAPRWTRIFRAYNSGVTNLQGDVTIEAVGTVYAKILGKNNQTLMSIYTVPADSTGYLLKYSATAINDQSASVISFTAQLRIREYGKVFRTQSITSVATNLQTEETFTFPLKLPPKTDVIFNITNANGNNGGVNCNFDIALL